MSRPPSPPPRARRARRAIGPRLRPLLWAVLALFALLGANSLYLAAVTLLEWWRGQTYQDWFYQVMFLVHLLLGLAVVVPFLIFGCLHARNTWNRKNRRAVRVGWALFAVALALAGTGFSLMRVGGFELRDPGVRRLVYWAHVALPLVCVWLFVLHRLVGPRLRWRLGVSWAALALALAGLSALLHGSDPRTWGRVGPESGERYFFPSLARTATGDFIPAAALQNDAYCQECHPSAHEDWLQSAHHFASFNNPAYLFSVRETRAAVLERDGSVQAARFCAGCHDPVPFFSGAFDDPDYDDEHDPTAHAGVTCTVCHAITHVNSRRGNADYTIEEPVHYPFAFSQSPLLRWVNRQLVKAKPALHKKTFLKPLHKSEEFCGACHKVHLPVELNGYKWLRAQDHLDSFHLSGVSGHGAQSFYYPEVAEENCNGCHMPLRPAGDDFGARDFDGKGGLDVHDHLFPSANTALASLVGLGDEVVERHAAFNQGAVRVDLFGLRQGGRVDGQLVAPLRPELPALEPGRDYLLEVVVRTLKVGHLFTEGTSDSNQVWLEVQLRAGGPTGPRVGASGLLFADGTLDPWAHRLNSFVLDREGNRIDRRNAQDIFVPLYSHQIPPGAADVVHYAFRVPTGLEALSVSVRLLYRKFDTRYLRYVEGSAFGGNDLPVLVLATDSLVLPVGTAETLAEASPIPPWQRWNDYGIGLLRKGDSGSNKGELRQAEEAFGRVEALGRPDGPLNLARVYFKEGRLDEAVTALQRATAFDPPAPPWTALWLSALVDKQNGYLDEAVRSLRELATLDSQETRRRKLDFSQDWRVLNELGQTLVERSKLERGQSGRARRDQILGEARSWFERTLELDPENLSAHWNLALIAEELGHDEEAQRQRALFERYRPDDNARDRAIAAARRRYPAADHAAEAVVVYPLQRDGAPGLGDARGGPAEGTR